MPSDSLRTSAWLLTGLTGSRPGTLEYADGRLVFESDERVVFDVALTELSRVRFPWYYFSGGVKFTIGQEHYRLSFVRPNHAPGGSVLDISEGRRAGKAWKSILLGQPRAGSS